MDGEFQVQRTFSWVKDFCRISYGITNSVRKFLRLRKWERGKELRILLRILGSFVTSFYQKKRTGAGGVSPQNMLVAFNSFSSSSNERNWNQGQFKSRKKIT